MANDSVDGAAPGLWEKTYGKEVNKTGNSKHECMTDKDCGERKFCKTGFGNLDKTTCHAKLLDWKACDTDKQ